MGKKRNNQQNNQQNNPQTTDAQKDQEDVNAQKDGDNKWSSKRFFAGSFIIILGFAASVYIAFWKFHSLTGLGLMGMGILLTVLIGSGILSNTTAIDTGEVRRAITISFISVFFGLMSFEGPLPDSNLFKVVSTNLWWVLVVIIGFYFGGRSAEEIVKNIIRVRESTRIEAAKSNKIKNQEVK